MNSALRLPTVPSRLQALSSYKKSREALNPVISCPTFVSWTSMDCSETGNLFGTSSRRLYTRTTSCHKVTSLIIWNQEQQEKLLRPSLDYQQCSAAMPTLLTFWNAPRKYRPVDSRSYEKVVGVAVDSFITWCPWPTTIAWRTTKPQQKTPGFGSWRNVTCEVTGAYGFASATRGAPANTPVTREN